MRRRLTRISNSILEDRTNRLKLAVRRKPYFVKIGKGGASLGYRRNVAAGSWLVRWADGKGGSNQQVFGTADDFDGGMDFWAAHSKAQELAPAAAVDHLNLGKPVTVAEALDDYQRDLELRGGLSAHVERVRKSAASTLLNQPVALLTSRELQAWRDAQLARGLAPASVTRVSKAFKAALTYVAKRSEGRIKNLDAWKFGLEALPDSNVARDDIGLSDDKVRAVVAACYRESERLGLFIEVLAVTGARPVQASRLLVGDLEAEGVTLPRAKKGKGVKLITRESFPLAPSLMQKLRAAAAGRAPTEPLLQRPDGQAWQSGRSDHSRPFERAVKNAGLGKIIPYALRHSSIVRMLLQGLSVQLVASVHDTSPRMLANTYAKHIANHAAPQVRAALIDLDRAGDNTAPALTIGVQVGRNAAEAV